MEKRILQNWTLKNDKVGELPVPVPSDVTAQLYKAGKICDPLYGTNAREVAWIAEEDWVYSTTFDVDEGLLQNERILLCFEGVDTLSEITLNGVLLGKTNNMFLAYNYEVKNLLKKESNCLEVKLFSVTKDIREKNDGKNYRALFTQDRIWTRKMQCSWGWDWAPNLPGVGLWLPVYLLGDNGVAIGNVKTTAYLSGDVRFAVDLCNKGSHLFQNEGGRYALRFTLDGKTKVFSITQKTQIVNLKIENPKLWWPNGYGEQNLYAYKVELLENGCCIDEKEGELGIREIVLDQTPLGEDRSNFALVVNGRKIFCKGSNWVPCSTMIGEVGDETYEKLLFAAKDANYNMLRVWGGGIYEKEIFYRLCDRLGIMLFHDFMFSCSAVPAMLEGIQENFLKEATYQIQRLRNHTCIALWCGGNEYMPHAGGNYYTEGNFLVRVILQGLCQEMDRECIYIHNSPYGLDDDEWRTTTGDAHISCLDEVLAENDFDHFRSCIARKPAQFISESAHMGPTRLRSLRKFIPQEELWPMGESWDYHFVENPYAPVPETMAQKEIRLAKGFFGESDSVEGFVKKAMLAHSELMTAEIDYARANPNCYGFMNWMFNDIWGCGTWSVIDYYGEKKPVLYAKKRAFAPRRIAFVEKENGLQLCLFNDRKEAVEGAAVYSLKTLDGKIVDEKRVTMSALCDGLCCIPVALEGEGAYMSAELTLSGGEKLRTLYFHKLWKDIPFESCLDWSFEEKEGGRYALNIKANAFARAVFIDTKDNDGVYYSDNFFDIEKGEERTVIVKSKRLLQKEDIQILTFADEWID